MNLQDSRTSWTVLIHASSKGDAAVAEALLESGADPNLHSKAGTALHLAAYNHHTAIVRALIARGAEVNAKERWTVLMGAVGGGSPSVVKLLLAHGANLNAKDDEKGHIYTALKIARSHERIFREHPPRSRLYAGGSDYAAMSSCSSKRERRNDARTRWPPGFDPLKPGAILPKYTSKC